MASIDPREATRSMSSSTIAAILPRSAATARGVKPGFMRFLKRVWPGGSKKTAQSEM